MFEHCILLKTKYSSRYSFSSQKEEIRKENNIKRSETRESCKSAIK